MLLNIAAEKTALLNEQKLQARLRYKLASQMRAFKEFHQLPAIAKSVSRHLSALQFVQTFKLKDVQTLKLADYISENRRIQSLVLRKGAQFKLLLEGGKFIPFVTLMTGVLSRYYACLQKIEKKLLALSKIISEILLRKKTKCGIVISV